jgi:predicted amidohydrolase YtcJ
MRVSKRDLMVGGLAAVLLGGAAVAVATAAPPGPDVAESVYWGGPIYTADDANPRVEAVAVRAGRIVYAGDRAGAKRLVGGATKVIDLKGAAMFPGFTDAHAHLRGIGERELTLNLEGTPSLAALVATVKARAAATPKGQLIIGRGWIETHWPEGRFPTRADLDAVSPDNPVLLERADGHALVANSAALRAAGITRATVAPSGGEILKDAAGEPAGMLVDMAMTLVEPIIPKPDAAFREKAFAAGFKVYSAYGWTGVHNMSVDWDDALMLEKIAARGAAPLRVYNAVTPEGAERLIAGGPRTAADGRVITRAVKFYMDGALGSRGAALLEKYADADSLGLVQMKKEDVLPVWGRALDRGIQITTHAIGDRGNRMTLDWYAEVFGDGTRGKAARWRVEHAQVISPTDIPRFGQLGVIPSMQPSHAIGDLYFAPKRLGPERLKGAYAWKSLIASGAIIPAGSDAPVERGDPLIEFYAATARRSLDGFQGPDWHPEEAVDRATALKMFTVWPAYASFREKELGMIKVGYRADLSVFSVDLMTAPFAAIPKGKALLTVLDGKTAYRAAGW